MSMEKIDGGSLEWNGQRFFFLATKEIVRAMKKAAIYTQGIAKEMVGGSGSGKEYKRGSRKHVASKAGDPPARDFGILASSISYEVEQKGAIVNGLVGPDEDKIKGRKPMTDPEYGLYLELGTDNMAPRPWLVPSVIKATPKIISIIRKAL